MDQQFGCRESVSILLARKPACALGLPTRTGSGRQQHCCRASSVKLRHARCSARWKLLWFRRLPQPARNRADARAQCELAHTSQAAACATIFRHVEPKCERNLSSLQARQYSGRGPTARLSAENRQGSCVLSGHHLDEHLQGVRPHELGEYGRSDHRRRCA
jgi:hypothetical protein